MVILFLLSLPGLVVIMIGLGAIQLIRARKNGTRRPGAGSMGLELLDTVLKPGSEYLVNEKESRRLIRDETEEGAAPFDHTLKKIRIKRKAYMMIVRRIMGTSGGFLPRDRWDLSKPGPTLLRMLELSKKERPRLCFIHTASGDNANYLARSYEAMSDFGCDVTHLQLFTQPNAPVREHILKSDVIWVGGGSVANLLAIWKLHGVDLALREAYENGVILGGVSAGSICWHQGGPTDSFGPQLQTVTNGLSFLPFGNAVHFDSEAQRRPLAHELIKNETFQKIYATDDGVGILYENEIPVEVITDRPSSPDGSAAYLIQKSDGTVRETRLNVGLLN